MQQHKHALLNDLVTLFEQYRIDYCVGWSTLLGFVREGDFLTHAHDDVDVAVFRPFYTEYPLWRQFVEALTKRDIYVLDASYNYLALQREPGLHADVHWMEVEGENLVVYVTGEKQIFPKSVILPSKELKLFDRAYHIPHHPERYLELLYGKTWKTENEHFAGHHNAEPVDNYCKITYPFIVSLHRP